MSNDIRLAFAHPSERAEASSDRPCDRISLKDYVVQVEIGAFQQERGHLQRVRFNVVVEVIPNTWEIDDDVDRILSYDRITDAISAEINAERINLLETLAARVAERILLEPQALRVFVRIEKLDRGPFALGVEIDRRKGETGRAHVHIQPEHPRVAFLSNAALQSTHLSAWIDTLSADRLPLIITVDTHENPVPQSASTPAQRRIDLLAIEQNAWLLASRDTRCMVVETRTELDWAMKNNQICVWAPSKIVLDAVESLAMRVGNTLALIGWFAEQMHAAELLLIGGHANEHPETSVPVRHVPAGEATISLR